MNRRQIAFGIVCFLAGTLVGMQLVANIDLLVRLIVVVLILLLLIYLLQPYLPRWIPGNRQAQRVQRKRTTRK